MTRLLPWLALVVAVILPLTLPNGVTTWRLFAQDAAKLSAWTSSVG